MLDSPQTELDLVFAESCLAGEEDDLLRLRKLLDGPVRNFLLSAGGRIGDAREILPNLCTELVSPIGARRPLLESYSGEGAILTWLNRIALNRLISMRRRESRDARRFDHGFDLDRVEASSQMGDRNFIVQILTRAIETGFARCTPEQFVMLHLIHSNGLMQEDVATMFRCSIATISRQLSQIRAEIRLAIEAAIKEQDPWLELKWDDFVALCATTSLHCLGAE